MRSPASEAAMTGSRVMLEEINNIMQQPILVSASATSGICQVKTKFRTPVSTSGLELDKIFHVQVEFQSCLSIVIVALCH